MSIGDTPLGPSWPDLRKLGEREASEVLKTEAIHWIGENPGRFARLAVTKAVLFWTPPYHEGKGNVTNTELLVRRLWAVQCVILLVAAMGGLCARTLRTRETAILCISVASYTAVHMMFYVIYRYREPIMPMVCILAAMSIATGLARLASPRRSGGDC
jgi:hypothetical protein